MFLDIGNMFMNIGQPPSKDWIDIIGIFGPTIAAFAAVYIAKAQWKIQKKQHNLALFEKRWKMLENLKQLGKKASDFKHIYYQDIKNDSEENFWNVKNEIDFFATKCSILFTPQIEDEIKNISQIFVDYHNTQDKLLDWNQYNEEYPQQYTKKDRINLIENKGKKYIELNEKFSSVYKDMLEFVKKVKVDND